MLILSYAVLHLLSIHLFRFTIRYQGDNRNNKEWNRRIIILQSICYRRRSRPRYNRTITNGEFIQGNKARRVLLLPGYSLIFRILSGTCTSIVILRNLFVEIVLAKRSCITLLLHSGKMLTINFEVQLLHQYFLYQIATGANH